MLCEKWVIVLHLRTGQVQFFPKMWVKQCCERWVMVLHPRTGESAKSNSNPKHAFSRKMWVKQCHMKNEWWFCTWERGKVRKWPNSNIQVVFHEKCGCSDALWKMSDGFALKNGCKCENDTTLIPVSFSRKRGWRNAMWKMSDCFALGSGGKCENDPTLIPK